jgi:hypothetical protein
MEDFFVDSLYGFETQFSYKKLENGLVIFDDPKDNNNYKLKFIATGPTFDIVSSALEESTYINHVTGSPFIRTSILYKMIFKNAIKQIEFPENEDLQSIDIKTADHSKMHYNLIKIVSKRWIKEVL